MQVHGSSGYVAVFGDGAAVIGTFCGLVLLAFVAAGLARRAPVLVALTGITLAGVLAVTVVPSGGWARLRFATDPLQSIRANLAPRPGDLSDWAHTADGPLNVALFVPFALLLALLLRRPLHAAAVAVALSAAIECYQASLTTRVGAFADVVSNGLGAVLGVTLAAVLLAVLPRAGAGQSPARSVARNAARPV